MISPAVGSPLGAFVDKQGWAAPGQGRFGLHNKPLYHAGSRFDRMDHVEPFAGPYRTVRRISLDARLRQTENRTAVTGAAAGLCMAVCVEFVKGILRRS